MVAAGLAHRGFARVADPCRVEYRDALGGGALAQLARRGGGIAVKAPVRRRAQRINRVAQVAEELAVLPAHHLRAYRREEAAARQVGRDPLDRLIGPGRVAADPEQAG